MKSLSASRRRCFTINFPLRLNVVVYLSIAFAVAAFTTSTNAAAQTPLLVYDFHLGPSQIDNVDYVKSLGKAKPGKTLVLRVIRGRSRKALKIKVPKPTAG